MIGSVLRRAGAPVITEAAEHVFLVSGTAVNWVVLTEGESVTLIDTGYPADLRGLLGSLATLGHRPEQIEAVLVTHAHIDHVGALPGLLDLVDVPVLTTEQEARHTRGEYRESATPAGVLRNVWRPGFLGWGLAVARAGGAGHVRIPRAAAFPAEGALDLPGHPVPVPTPGHTSGHCCYHLPAAGAVVTGDALVTGHPTARAEGPQLLGPLFNHDEAGTAAALGILETIDADLVLPGHGPVHRGPLPEAARLAAHRFREGRGGQAGPNSA